MNAEREQVYPQQRLFSKSPEILLNYPKFRLSNGNI